MTELIVALDTGDLPSAELLAKTLAGEVAAFKVGLSLYTAHGPEALLAVGQHGRVFCDLKLHDIPSQVRGAAQEVAKRSVWMFTVHASGGPEMIAAAVEGALTPDPPIVAAVTVLTSLTSEGLRAVGQGSDPLEVGDPRHPEGVRGVPTIRAQARRLARLAVEAGAGAVVCSAREIQAVREEIGPETKLVVPGVRPAGSAAGDQSRVATPAAAAAAGADFLVVGRPITESDDPPAATRSILREIAEAS